jgi:hypothetical protein
MGIPTVARDEIETSEDSALRNFFLALSRLRERVG